MFTLAAPAPKDALVLEDRRVSYDELLARARQFGDELGVAPGERVVVFADNGLAWAVAAYAVLRRQAVLVPLDALSTVEEAAYVLRDCRPAAVLFGEETRERSEEAVASVEREAPDDAPRLRSLEGLLDAPLPSDPPRALHVQDLEKTAVIIYTSGTTGDPKGVMLSYRNLEANVRAVSQAGYYQPDDRVLLILPLHHVFPLMGNLIAPLATGGTSVLSPSLAREDIVRTLGDERITMIIGVPRFYELLGRAIEAKIQASALARTLYALARKVGSEGLSRRLFGKVHRGFGGHLRYMISGGAALDPEIAELFAVLGFRLCEGYGMTECAPMISFPRPDAVKPGTCGRPLPGSDVELRDGEIVVRGPQVMPGYFERPEETAAILRDGWLWTGDLGRFDEDGNLQITGRKKEILVLPSGKNVNPALTEDLIKERCPAVAEVGVFLDGGVLHALVVAEPGAVPPDETDLESWLWEEAIAPYNERVAPYRQVARLTVGREPLPRTRLEKLKRHHLADAARQVRATDEEATPDEAAMTPTESRLVSYLSKACRQPARPAHRLGADLGLDSLARLELSEFVETTFGVPLTETDLEDRLRVRELAARIDAQASGTAEEGTVSWARILKDGQQIHLPPSSAIHAVLLAAFRVFVHALWKFRVRGADRLPAGKVLFAPNHQSGPDGFLLTAALPQRRARDLYFLGKSDHLKPGWRSWLAERSRVIVLDRAQGVKASLQAVARALSEGYSAAVFPEGTRTRSGKLGDFKEGYAIVAREMGVPIVPVAIRGAYDVLPPGAVLPRLFRRIDVEFLDPVEASEEAPAAINERVRESIRRALQARR